MEAYCVRCKVKRELRDTVPVFTSNGAPATQGICTVCGARVFKMGRTPEHDGLDANQHTVVAQNKVELAAKPKMVIVESPAKARTVGRFLGKDYIVRASVGHIRDLPTTRMGVDIDDGFRPHYVIPEKRKEVVRELREEVRNASEVYLATDPDREGEAISWHLVEALRRALSKRPVHRVEFHEITEEAIAHAFAHPRPIDMRRVDAQQARRILDRIVGYTLSPLMRDKFGRRGLSAGRVQSVGVRLVVEREREIQAFVPTEFWKIAARLAKHEPEREQPRSFIARLHRIGGEEVALHNQAEADAVVAALQSAVYVVTDVKEGQRHRRPSPPFTTSTLQQEASRRLGFTARRTMSLAQQLYEGIDLGDGPIGLITYMRTDSTNVAAQAQKEAQEFISQTYGQEFVPPKPPHYRTQAKGAQEAHEAIRPTSVFRTPQSLKPYLDPSQYRLYELIWRRFLASQMMPAVYDTLAVEIVARPSSDGGDSRPYVFRANGSNLRFAGFLVVYEEAKDEDVAEDEEGAREEIPPLAVDERLDLVELLPSQHFTQPPPRYTEATLVRALEEYGIGRPSTYAPILTTIQQRGYVQRRNGRLYPTELGIAVTDLLVEYFPEYIDVGFTAQMEEDLDRIAAGERDWVMVLREFYEPFAATLAKARERMPQVRMGGEPTGEVCPQCGAPLIFKYGRFGKFIGCSNYPQCRYKTAVAVRTGVRCPECGGELVEKRTRRGHTFYGCSNYNPEDPTACRFGVWKRPLVVPCPACGGLLTEARPGWAKCLACEDEFELNGLPGAEAEPSTVPEGGL